MSKITLKKVTLSFPSLFEKAVFEGKEGKYEATFLIDKSDKKLKAELDAAIEAALKEAKIKRPTPDRICLKDGDESEYEGCAGRWTFKAGNKKRPIVIDRDKTPLSADEAEGKIYAGAVVNAMVDIWIQDNKYGKRVNANLYAVQFVEEGEPLGNSGPISIEVADEFENLDGEL